MIQHEDTIQLYYYSEKTKYGDNDGTSSIKIGKSMRLPTKF